jgi:phospholipid-binding lipoprotein MlaA
VNSWRNVCIAAVLALLVAGCGSAPTRYDPLEPVNRAVFKFNDKADQFVLKPIAQTYKTVAPVPVRKGISNFFGNVADLLTGVNNVLQGKPAQAGDDFGRVILNSSFGLGGLIDIASEAGIDKHDEDLGQTFGVWGMGPGPYLVLPLLGPSSVRDGMGTLVTGYYLDPVSNLHDVGWRNSLLGLRFIDARAQYLGTEGLVEEAALDKYAFIRRAYLQRRRNLVYDGKPPPENDSDD